MAEAIEIRALTKRFGDTTALDGLSLTVKEGTCFSLLGVNGAGKSTLIKILSCLLLPTEGSAALFGKDVVAERNAVKAMIGVSPQETAVAGNLTAKENLLFFCDLYGVREKEARTRELIGTFGLESVAEKRAKNLSGGFQRRLSIALALVHRPKILFLDEPSLGLDVLSRRELWDLIRSLSGVTVMLTTHYMEEAEALSDRVGILSQGALKAVGTPQELIGRTGAGSFEDAFVTLVKEDRR